ncbi:MAG: hypothetical protein GY845_18695 [Planctomycetes bacterium]|nr:hypothetical protein [Planctomycetota bacterium]
MKKHVKVLILVICICIAFLLLISASLLFISEVAYKSNAGLSMFACENTLRAIGYALEAYKSNHEGSSPSSLLELKDDIKEKYTSDSAGVPLCFGNRNDDEIGHTSYYVYNPSLSTDENRPICWDSTPHRIRSRFLSDTYVWNVLYADGHVERLRRRGFLSLMRSIGIRDPNFPSPKDYYNQGIAHSDKGEYGQAFSGYNKPIEKQFKPKISIYLTQYDSCYENVGPRENLGIRQRLFDINTTIPTKALFTEEQIKHYNWKTHEVELVEGIEKKLPVPTVFGTPVLVMADGKKAYVAAIWTMVSSVSTNLPVILHFDVQDGAFRIQLGYPTAIGIKEDPREKPLKLQ